MKETTRKAYAKVNLGLDVLGRRTDGYHEVKMVMQTIGLYDEINIIKKSDPGIRLLTDSRKIPTDPGNLAYRAAEMMLGQYCPGAGIEIRLQKRIPVAAGMAGGSSDAAAVFHALNELFDLGLTGDELCEMGVKIGADVPYCIIGGTALAEGIGEKLTRLPSPPDCRVVLVKPAIGVSTKWVYENLHADRLGRHPDIDGMVAAIEAGDLAGITGRMENVLATVTEKRYPVIGKIKARLLALGAENALMSGSGPTVFGIFADTHRAEKAVEELRRLRKEKDVFLTTFTRREAILGRQGMPPKNS